MVEHAFDEQMGEDRVEDRGNGSEAGSWYEEVSKKWLINKAISE
jgi:hypothetical protein